MKHPAPVMALLNLSRKERRRERAEHLALIREQRQLIARLQVDLRTATCDLIEAFEILSEANREITWLRDVCPSDASELGSAE